jgi:MoxR-like ATPase
MRKLEVAALDVSGKIKTLEHIFDDMHTRSRGLGQSGYLLGGDTGVGKTSFVRDLAQLLGLELVMIETPHIVEEHIIDIPFIVVKPNGEASTKREVVDTKSSRAEFDIKFAKSHLFTTLVASKQAPDAALLAQVQKRQDLFMIWEKLGGTATTIPDEIKQLRAKFKTILFLDEYFRQTSNSIRNMLRSILNGRIGQNTIPADIYVLFASNLVDSGVGDILENEDFVMMNFDTPNLDEWFAYLITKYKNNPKIKLDEELLHDFYKLMKKNAGSLSTDDMAADVRVSPRRWEQLVVYLSTALPVKDQRDADLLLKNVAVNFQNYVDGKQAEIAKDVLKTVKDLIKERQEITGDEKNVKDHDWRETLEHQIKTRMKAGEARKYVPVIAGPPGAGKTKHIKDIATDLNLVPIVIDVQNASPEEAIGVPLAKEGKNDSIEVAFSKPPMNDDIQNQMKEGEKHLKERLIKFHGADAGGKMFAAWQKSDTKYLIFFDELNRTNVKVFNAMRKVLLEKEFNDEYKLPPESILVAAINPTGKGVIELTKHVRDVFDVIPVGLDWNQFQKHLGTINLGVDPVVADFSRNVITAFADRFKLKGGAPGNIDPHFYLSIGPTPLYISGREYNKMLVLVAQGAERAYQREVAHLGEPGHEVDKSEAKVRGAIADKLIHALDHIIKNKHGVDAPEFNGDLREWALTTDGFSLGDAFKKKVKTIKNLSALLDRSFADQSEDLFNEQEFINYVTSVDATVFKEDLTEFMTNAVMKDAKNAFAKFGKEKTLAGTKAKVTAKEVSKLEFITREVLHALKLHDISNKMMQMVKVAVRDTLEKVADAESDTIMDVMNFSREMNAYIKKLSV